MGYSGEKSHTKFRKVSLTTQKKKRGINKQTKKSTNAKLGDAIGLYFSFLGKEVRSEGATMI
jgi:hypothetical protein